MRRSILARAVPALLVVLGLAAASVGLCDAAGRLLHPGRRRRRHPRHRPQDGEHQPVGHERHHGHRHPVPLAVGDQPADRGRPGRCTCPTRPGTGTRPRPIVSVAQGTQGLSDNCAPSKSLVNGLNYELGYVQALLARGWAVAVTDYEGLGTPGKHTYIVGRRRGPRPARHRAGRDQGGSPGSGLVARAGRPHRLLAGRAGRRPLRRDRVHLRPRAQRRRRRRRWRAVRPRAAGHHARRRGVLRLPRLRGLRPGRGLPRAQPRELPERRGPGAVHGGRDATASRTAWPTVRSSRSPS